MGKREIRNGPPIEQYRKQLGKHSNDRAKKTFFRDVRKRKQVCLDTVICAKVIWYAVLKAVFTKSKWCSSANRSAEE